MNQQCIQCSVQTVLRCILGVPDNSFLQVDSRVRPFLSSPLRLAATGRECCAFDKRCDSYYHLGFDLLNKHSNERVGVLLNRQLQSDS